ncbi:CKLF-like MARVEL transmembrane domain-containing protein 6 [Pantherophis guttatus]|uniref:CKLF-like MARVEL transmembrane domain-containing protein 6 n=1 Tax=Pantherophis guttatus TaxID=94885 RepID=A0A6P9AV12_PANGU|nr:CKLF-like MARVEL transmembrane domain-containing protein 6 [Pantherophis guttatus]XP_060539740.1 CKLF-like MARVEL transmembrane domain-containing protein 6 [Pantherophis guttatus]
MENGVPFYEQPGVMTGPNKWPCMEHCTLKNLSNWRLSLKFAQVMLSFLAFIAEEAVMRSNSCPGLYIFEFASCGAFILSILILALYCTTVYQKAGEDRVTCVDFFVAAVVGLLFFLASIIFTVTAEKQLIENTAITFGFCASTLFLVDGAQIMMKRIVEEKLLETIPTLRRNHRDRRDHERRDIQMLNNHRV